MPSEAANLAVRSTRRDACSSYESGTSSEPQPRLPLSIGDGELAETADCRRIQFP